MAAIKNIASLIILPFIMFSFSQCSSQKKLQKEAPLQFEGAYCQTWIGGLEGAGSGINIFIPAKAMPNANIELDSVYFRGKSAKLTTKPQNNFLFIGRFSTAINQKKDIIMSADGKQEFGNEMPIIPEKIPFELKEDECVISYKEGNKTKYFKINNIVEKKAEYYPSAPPNRQ